MTRHKDFKALVRARMARTGETYTAARQAVLATPPPATAAAAAAAAEQRRIVRRMFDHGRLRSIPARRKLRAAVLLEVLAGFDPARTYRESEVSEQLAAVHDDFAYLRRELVSLGYLCRWDGRYRVCGSPPPRTDRERQELPSWEAIWLPGFVAGRPLRTRPDSVAETVA